MTKRKQAELHEAVQKLAPAVEPPWTKEDHERSRRSYQRMLEATKGMQSGTQRRGVQYWQWVLEQAKARRLPATTITTAKEMVERLSTPSQPREPGEDREEELELNRVPLPYEEKRHGSSSEYRRSRRKR